MRKIYGVLGLAASLSIGAIGQTVIIEDDFEAGIVGKVSGRFRVVDFDSGWFANLSSIPSEWMLMDGMLQNSATNTGAYPDYLPSEGAACLAVTTGDDTNNVIDISFDYDVSTNDTLFMHFWAYNFSGEGTPSGNVANFQSGGGALGDSSGGIVGMTSYKLLSSIQVTGNGTYTNSIDILDLLLDDIETVAGFDYYQIAFAKSEDGELGTTSVDNLLISSTYVAPDGPPPPPPSGVTWENDMSADPVGDGWVVRNGKDGYTMGDGILIMAEGAFGTLLDTNPYNGFDGITKVDFRWRNTSHHEGNYGAGIWLNCDGDTPEYYPTILSSVLNTNDNMQTVKIFDPGNGASLLEVPGFGTGMIDAQLTIDPYNKTVDYILTDGSLSVTGSVITTAAATAGTTIDHTLFTPGPSCEVDYVRIEANAYPDEVFIAAEPTELLFTVSEGGAAVADEADVIFNARTNLELVITIEDESHPGTFSVLSDTPQVVFSQGETTLEFGFDPSVSNLVGGMSATGLAVIAWSELGGGDSGELAVELTGAVTYTAGQANPWAGSGDGSSWGDAANWGQGRIPGAIAADAASISGGATVTVASDFNGIFPWDNVLDGGSTLNIYADLMGGGDLTVGFSGDGFVNQTNGAASVGAFSMKTMDSSMQLMGGSFTVEDAFELNGPLTIDGGDLIIDNADAGFAFAGTLGTVNIKSGSFSTTRTVAQQASSIAPAFEISGGSLTVGNQHYWSGGGLTIIGSDPVINLKYMNSTCTINMLLDEQGIATVNLTGWNHLSGLSLTVDGTDYIGGSREFLLFDGAINSTSTAINVIGFPDGVNAYVTQDMDINEVKLIVEWPGYDGWTRTYGLSVEDAAFDADYDVDGANNFYEYAMGGDPTNAAVIGYEAKTAIVDVDGTSYFEYISTRRIGTEEETELIYEVQSSTALPHDTWSGADVVEVGVAPIDSEFEAVTNRVDMTGKDEAFMRLYVESLN
ncbi:hypothetical protein P4C99_13180 [Pontiellaceae bacterium B1224]|nr:hypothetical protein [Pontiellaceae bacterium B1224]